MIAALIVAALLLSGIGVRRLIPLLERVRIPASVVAGLIGCLIAQALILTASPLADEAAAFTATFGSWGSILISLVFAELLLAPSDRPAHRSREVWQQGIAAWFIILGQLALGLLATALFIKPFYNVPAPFGQFIEVTMAGGFGSANSMATLLEGEPYRFPAARDLLVFGATVGLLWGIVSGLILTRIGQKRGWTTQSGAPVESTSASELTEPRAETRERAVDPILLQLCFLGMALGLGLLMQWGVASASARLDSRFDPGSGRIAKHLGDLPLFFFALLGGWLMRTILERAGLTRLLDRRLLQRLTSITMDILIVTSLAGIALSKVSAFLFPVLLLLAIGSVWSAWCLIWVSPRLLPRRYWFELGLINYGFSTAATAQGMMFLKLVDPKLKSGAAETYALGAPLTAPFIGGGVITFAVLPPTLGGAGLMPVGLAALLLAGALFCIGHWINRQPQALQ